MKISYSWLGDYIETNYSVQEIAEVLTSTGLEVEAVEKMESIPGGLKGVVVGEVIECGKHPDADRLSITKVNVGGDELLSIVCGAPNVAAGQKVLVATIGAKLYPKEGEPFVIKKGKIRGQESHGMICAEDELGLGSSHAGIMVLDEAAIVGTPASTYLQISEDYCIEIGLTPNRTDAISHFGVARDLHAGIRNMIGVKADQPRLKKPEVNVAFEVSSGKNIQVDVRDTEGCPRYCGITISNIKVAPSPEWLQKRLTTIGLRPINNIVDITNYVQHEIGQPLHAFDASQIEGDKVIVRRASEGEKFVTLDEIERELSSSDLMICDNNKPMCIAGVFGGKNSGVTDSTQAVFLESAYFNAVSIRKTARRHGLHTDASFRFERGCDPNMTLWALQRATRLILEITGGNVSSETIDIYTAPVAPVEVQLNWQSCFKLIGKDIGRETIKKILNDLEIKIKSENEEGMTLLIPSYRNDVLREADVIEEILRIYGYDNIEIPKQLRASLSYSAKVDPEKQQTRVSDYLTANGFAEMMSMSLTKTKYLDFARDDQQRTEAIALLNPLSADLGMMRQSMLFSGLEAIGLNRNHRNSDLRLYEFGKIYSRSGDKYFEGKKLALFVTGRKNPESWNNQNNEVSFADLSGVFENLTTLLGVRGLKSSASEHEHFDDALEYRIGKELIATLGNVRSSVLEAFDIRTKVWYAEIHWDGVLKSIPENRSSYSEPEKFPAVRRDLSLLIDKATKYAEIERLAFDAERKLLRKVNLFDVYEGKNLEEGKKSYALNFVLQDSGKTMTDQQVDAIMSKIQKSLEEKLGATLRS